MLTVTEICRINTGKGIGEKPNNLEVQLEFYNNKNTFN